MFENISLIIVCIYIGNIIAEAVSNDSEFIVEDSEDDLY